MKYRELRDRADALWRENQWLRAQLDSCADQIVPFTIEQHYPIGTTVPVRIPRRFQVRDESA